MRQIEVGEETYTRLLERARDEGLADVPAYLDRLAGDDDGFEMTPELAAALEDGLEDIRQGRVVSLDVVRKDRARLRAEWLASHP